MERDPELDTLLDLDGQVLVVDPKGEYWVKFVVHRVDASPARPHGLSYSLSLHCPDNRRLVGFECSRHAEIGRTRWERQSPI